MAVLKNNQSLYPFFGDRFSYTRGLDPLGLQNNSEATFNLLLPGLNNVTGRLRYYSFYCWVLDQYSLLIGSLDDKIQRSFMRKAEFLVALIMSTNAEEYSNVPGSNYAMLQREKKLSTFDLNQCVYNADGSTNGTYWKYSTGAFGQYYVASLVMMNLLGSKENEKLYARTNKKEGTNLIAGQELAEAFDQNLHPNHKKTFLDAVMKGLVTRDELIEMYESFDMMNIPDQSKEQTLLQTMLLQADRPADLPEVATYFRKNTLRYYLAYIGNSTTDKPFRYFTRIKYQEAIKSLPVDKTLLGWYYYQVNEYFQFANTAIFNGVLDFLNQSQGLNAISLIQFCDSVTDHILQDLQENFEITGDEPLNEILSNELISQLDEQELVGNIEESTATQRVCKAFQLMILLFVQNQTNFPQLLEFGELYKIKRDGEAVTYYTTNFIHKRQINLKMFIHEYILQHIILRHQLVAYRKTGNGIQSTQKFVIEEGTIRFIDNFSPAFTSPRLVTLNSFLYDLKLVEHNQLTSKGSNLLKDQEIWQ